MRSVQNEFVVSTKTANKMNENYSDGDQKTRIDVYNKRGGREKVPRIAEPNASSTGYPIVARLTTYPQNQLSQKIETQKDDLQDRSATIPTPLSVEYDRVSLL